MLSLRATWVLCVLTLLLAAWTCWTVAGAGVLPAFWLANPPLALHFIAGFSIALAALGSPYVFTREESRGGALWPFVAKAFLAALWFSAAAAFMLLTASRVSPVGDVGISQAALWIFFVAWFAMMLERAAPRAGAGIFFAWIVALPISAYMLAEVFLGSPAGSAGLTDSTAPQAAALRATIRWILNLSPGTAALGALDGTLADGSAYSVWSAVAAMILSAGILIWVACRQSN